MATQHPTNTPPTVHGYWPPAPPRRPFSGWAITGFVASLLSLGIVGFPLSIYGAVHAGRRNLRGQGLAVAGILIGSVWAFVNVTWIAALISTFTS